MVANTLMGVQEEKRTLLICGTFHTLHFSYQAELDCLLLASCELSGFMDREIIAGASVRRIRS